MLDLSLKIGTIYNKRSDVVSYQFRYIWTMYNFFDNQSKPLKQ